MSISKANEYQWQVRNTSRDLLRDLIAYQVTADAEFPHSSISAWSKTTQPNDPTAKFLFDLEHKNVSVELIDDAGVPHQGIDQIAQSFIFSTSASGTLVARYELLKSLAEIAELRELRIHPSLDAEHIDVEITKTQNWLAFLTRPILESIPQIDQTDVLEIIANTNTEPQVFGLDRTNPLNRILFSDLDSLAEIAKKDYSESIRKLRDHTSGTPLSDARRYPVEAIANALANARCLPILGVIDKATWEAVVKDLIARFVAGPPPNSTIYRQAELISSIPSLQHFYMAEVKQAIAITHEARFFRYAEVAQVLADKVTDIAPTGELIDRLRNQTSVRRYLITVIPRIIDLIDWQSRETLLDAVVEFCLTDDGNVREQGNLGQFGPKPMAERALIPLAKSLANEDLVKHLKAAGCSQTCNPPWIYFLPTWNNYLRRLQP